MHLLVLADEPVDAARVRAALPGEPDLEGARVLVVAPARNASRLAFWVSDSDEAIADARDVEEQSVAALQAGTDAAAVAGEVGESEPLLALRDALVTFPADLVLLLTGDDDLEAQARDALDVRVVRA
jgi:broad specificity polyphosphatase/5'/3'-nucleotidase SurE